MRARRANASSPDGSSGIEAGGGGGTSLRFGGGAKLLGGANRSGNLLIPWISNVLCPIQSYYSLADHNRHCPSPCSLSASCDEHITGPSSRGPRGSSHHCAGMRRSCLVLTGHICRPNSAGRRVPRDSSCASSSRRAAASRPCTHSHHLPWQPSLPRCSSEERQLMRRNYWQAVAARPWAEWV